MKITYPFLVVLMLFSVVLGGQRVKLHPVNTSIGIIVLGQSKLDCWKMLGGNPDGVFEQDKWDYPDSRTVSSVTFADQRVLEISGSRLNSAFSMGEELLPIAFNVGAKQEEVYSQLGEPDLIEGDGDRSGHREWHFPQFLLEIEVEDGTVALITLRTSVESLKDIPTIQPGWAD